MKGLGILLQGEAPALGAGGEGKVGQGGGDDVEGRVVFPTICEKRENPGDFEKIAWLMDGHELWAWAQDIVRASASEATD